MRRLDLELNAEDFGVLNIWLHRLPSRSTYKTLFVAILYTETLNTDQPQAPGMSDLCEFRKSLGDK